MVHSNSGGFGLYGCHTHHVKPQKEKKEKIPLISTSPFKKKKKIAGSVQFCFGSSYILCIILWVVETRIFTFKRCEVTIQTENSFLNI